MSTPIHVFARWKVKEGNMPVVVELLKVVHTRTRQEKGNLFYKIHQSQADANTLILFEGYENEAAQKAHVNAEHFIKVVVEQIVPLLEEREVTLATPIDGLT
ncbi:MAG: antibiotic biosynthesis monooxygenase [Niastella sp.]|nr:antibiotic biosynthesis monooxygenase [Niastella sp.]